MPEWEITIQGNTIFRKIYKSFMEAYDIGEEVGSISEGLIELHADYIDDIFDSHPFWFALAYAQWKVHSLDPAVYATVREIIEGGKDSDVWQYQAAIVRLKRQRVVKAFLEKISETTAASREVSKYQVGDMYKETTRLFSPDRQKGLVIYELQEPEGDVYTSAFLFSNTCNTGVFKTIHTGWNIQAEWQNDQKLVIKYPAGITFDEQTIEVYIKAKTISINYVPIDD